MSERSETDKLFMKVVEPHEVFEAVDEAGDWYSPCLTALGHKDSFQLWDNLRKHFAEGVPLIAPGSLWMLREAARVTVRLRVANSFPWPELANECEPDSPSGTAFWRWFTAPAYGDPSKIRYTPSAAYGQSDRQIVTTLGKFLQKQYPNLGPERIRYWANKYSGATGPVTLLFADTPDEVERVYRQGPESCMSHRTSNYSTDEHPSRLWGYCKDTKVAYMEEEGEISARCLVRVSNKTYIRIYPNCAPRFEAALQAAGFEQDDDGLRGLRVPAISQGDRGGYLMPYVDYIGSATFDGSHFVLGRGDVDVQSTGGVCFPNGEGNDESWQCPSCDAWHDDDESSLYSQHHNTTFCDHCSDNYVHANTSRGTDWIRDGDTVEVNGTYYLNNAATFERYDLIEIDGDVMDKSDATRLHNGVYVRDGELEEGNVVEFAGGGYAWRDDCHDLNGSWYLIGSAEHKEALEAAGQMQLPTVPAVPAVAEEEEEEPAKPKEWTEEEDKRLLVTFDVCPSRARVPNVVAELAKAHGRTEKEVRARLEYYHRLVPLPADQYQLAA